MKKFLAIILALTLVLSMSVTVFAEQTPEGTQTVSVDVPTPCYDYTVNIPASCTIEYGNTNPQSIGSVTVKSDYWENILADYSNLYVIVRHPSYMTNTAGDELGCRIGNEIDSNNNFLHPNDGYTHGWIIAYSEDGAGLNGRGNLYIQVPDWSSAKPGESYSLTITYASELIK